jgi:hypothetical protein
MSSPENGTQTRVFSSGLDVAKYFAIRNRFLSPFQMNSSFLPSLMKSTVTLNSDGHPLF